MAVVQRHHDDTIVNRYRGAVRERPVVRARRHPEIVDDQVQVLLWDDLPDLVLDSLEDLFGLLNASARRRADMKLDHAAVDRRIEIAADKDEHDGAEREHHDSED